MATQQLTITRFFAAILVVIVHFGLDTYPFNMASWSFFFESGRIYVSYFFVLSGFVMTIAYGNRKRLKVKQYYLNRIARIYPVYLAAILLLIVAYFLIERKVLWFEVILQASLIHSWIPRFSLTFNYVSWSLVVEAFFYLILPFVWPLIRTKWFFAIVTLSWILTQLIVICSEFNLLNVSSDFILFHPTMHLNEFLIGILGGTFYLKRKSEKNYFIHLLVVLVLFIVLLLLEIPYVEYRNGFLAPIFVSFIYLLSLDKMSRKLLSHPACVFLGDISYSIYILQVPVLYLTKFLLSNSYNFYTYLIVLILFSAIIYKWIEKPLQVKIRTIKV